LLPGRWPAAGNHLVVSIRRWRPLSVPAEGLRYFARACWRAVANFLAIVGVVAVVFGLLYRFAAGQIPHVLQAHAALLRGHAALLQGQAATGANSHRASFLLGTGALSLLVAWLIRPRRKP
jgi:hypothetical protein